ncbi:NAD(P)-binding domain-containing protein [Actinophytocola sp.]|jgi:UDP-N-acetyl-D-glucosamine dehydrogenase|uniref:NAD(P)-binding domain-containing protein n=1 Tax=Actinophytocola sp. TaxID=1872138 RepID=UPI002EDB0AF0
MTATFSEQVRTEVATVGVVGLGFTGLPLALSLADAGVLTTGLDTDRAKIAALLAGESYLPEIPPSALEAAAAWFEPTWDPSRLAGLDAYVICVPAPVGADGVTDLRYVEWAADTVGAVLHRGSLVVLRSPVPPGTAANLAARLAARSQLRPGVDFHVTVSPERFGL